MKRHTKHLSVVFFIAVLIVLSPVMPWGEVTVFAQEGPRSFSGLAKEITHPVVNVSTTQLVQGRAAVPPGFEDFFRHFFGEMPPTEQKTHALGSGFIIDTEGHILTNNHVVEKATEITVKLEFGKEFPAKVVGTDPQTDLALIKIEPGPDLPKPAKLGDSDALSVGDWVIAVGNPFGLGHTVTQGILSARGRVIGAGPYDDFLQTDAAINPGNSGGPLFDEKGMVIGINTAIVAGGQGIGFAIPINMAKSLLPQLKAGKVVRGWIGVAIQNITPDLAKSFHLTGTKGVLVSDVFGGGPAAKAGIQRGDVITRFTGQDVESGSTLARLVASTQPGTKATVDIIRDGKPESLTLTVGTKPQAGLQEAQTQREAFLGLTVQDLTPEVAQGLGLGPDEHGVIVSNVTPGSPAADAGIQPGDLIKEVNRQQVKDLSDYDRLIAEVKPQGIVLFLVKRGEQTFYITVKSTE